MKTIVGNLLEQKPGILCHQVNLYGVMGSGLALQIRERWPLVHREYANFCRTRAKLGDIFYHVAEPDVLIANLFGQSTISRDKCVTDYESYPAMLKQLALKSEMQKLPLYIPVGIGCGIAGGDWQIMSSLIEQHAPNAIRVEYAP